MIYLALATVATAAIFPLPLRTASPMPREDRPPTEPPTPAIPDDLLTPLIAANVPDHASEQFSPDSGNECDECEAIDDALWAEVAGVIAIPPAGSGATSDDEDDDVAADLVSHDQLSKPAPGPSRGDQMADLAAGLAGLPYQWGGVSPGTGFDCSGLVYYVHRQFGVTLNRDAAAQFANGRSISRGELQPGDIVFFADTYTRGISHDGIYLGGGRFVHAVQPGSGVRITSMGDGYWSPKFVGARRVFD
jgi:cell wall-associated NlpC family hydrolase